MSSAVLTLGYGSFAGASKAVTLGFMPAQAQTQPADVHMPLRAAPVRVSRRGILGLHVVLKTADRVRITGDL